MIRSISKPSDNLWMVVVVQRVNGELTVIPMDVPADLYRRLIGFLSNELGRKPKVEAIGT